MSETALSQPRLLARRAADWLRAAAGRRRRPALTFTRSLPGLRLKRRPPVTATAILPSLACAGRPALWRQVSRRITDQVTAVKPRYFGHTAGAPADPGDLPLAGPTFSLPAPDDEPNFEAETAAAPPGPPLSIAQLREVLARRSQAETPPPAKIPTSRLSPRLPRPGQPQHPQPSTPRLQTKRQRFSRIEELSARPAERSASLPPNEDPSPVAERTAQPAASPVPAESTLPPEPGAPLAPPPTDPRDSFASPPVTAPAELEPGREAGPTVSPPGAEPAPLSPRPPLSVSPPRSPISSQPEREASAPSPPQPSPPAQPAASGTAAPVVQAAPLEKPWPPARPGQSPAGESPLAAQPRPTSPLAAESEPVPSQDALVPRSNTQAEKILRPAGQAKTRLQTQTPPALPPVQRRPADVAPAEPRDLPAETTPGQGPPILAEPLTPAAIPDPMRSQVLSDLDRPWPGPVEPLPPESPPVTMAAKTSADLPLSRPQHVARRVAAKRSQWTRTAFKPLSLPAPALKLHRTASPVEASIAEALTDDASPIDASAGADAGLPAKPGTETTVQTTGRTTSQATAARPPITDRRPPEPGPARLEPRPAAPADLPLPIIHRPAAPRPVVVQRQLATTYQPAPALTPEPEIIARQPAANVDMPAPAPVTPLVNKSSTSRSPTGSSDANLDDLARQIYPLLKRRLALELERQPRW